MIKACNLFCGVGGNRKLWQNVDVTAVELDPKIAAIYQDFFPDDKVVVADAHEYLLNHYSEYDFIWASPPCPTHSDIRRCGVQKGQYKALYPDMMLYQEIILLMHFAPKKCKWVIENVKPYYDLLIKGQYRGRHMFWSNFRIHHIKTSASEIDTMNNKKGKDKTGFDLSPYDRIDKRKAYRNCVDSKLGLHVFNCAFKNIQDRLF